MMHKTRDNTSGAGGAHIGFSMFGARSPLLAPADPGGGGAGGQPGQPGGDPAGGGGDGGTPLSEAAKKEVADMINGHINASLTNHLGRFKKQFSEEITGMLGQSLNPLSEQIKAMAEAAKVQQQQPPPGGAQPGAVPMEIQNAMKRYEDRIKELEATNKATAEAREQEKAARLRDEERTVLSTALRNAGLPDTTVKAAVALLHTEDKRVARTEEGKIVFKIPKGTGAAAYIDEMDVEHGVTEWLKTDEGKSMLPARPAQGAGGQPARPGGMPRNKNEAKEQATADLAKMLLGGGGI